MEDVTEGRGTRSQRLFARWYPGVMERAEAAGQAALRARHLARASGRTLDLGTGNGFSVPHYTGAVTELVMVEPNPVLREQLHRRTSQILARAWRIEDADAAALPYADDSFDTVSAALVFCSLDQPDVALAEVARVLRPGGTFLFHEHVRGTGLLRVLHEVVTPVQRRVADGCRPNRDFLALLDRSPLRLRTLERLRMPGAAGSVTPLVVGAADLPGGPSGPTFWADRPD